MVDGRAPRAHESGDASDNEQRHRATRYFLGSYARANPAILEDLRGERPFGDLLPSPGGFSSAAAVALGQVEPVYVPPTEPRETDLTHFRRWCAKWAIPATPEVAAEIMVTEFAWVGVADVESRPGRRLRWGFETPVSEATPRPLRVPSRKQVLQVLDQALSLDPEFHDALVSAVERASWLRVSALRHRDALQSPTSRHDSRKLLRALRWLARKQAVRDPEAPEFSAYTYEQIKDKLVHQPKGRKASNAFLSDRSGAAKALRAAADLIGLAEILPARAGRRGRRERNPSAG